VFRLLRFVVFFALLTGLLIFVILPALISPVLTQYVRDMGVKADTLTISVDTFDPGLLQGRAARLRVEGTNVEIGRAKVGRLDLTLGNVSFLDRSFQSVDGQMDDVSVAASGLSAEASQVDVVGPSSETSATGQFDSAQSEDMVKAAAQRAGLTLDKATLVDGGLQLQTGGVAVSAAISVEGGALVLRPAIGSPMILLQPAPSDPWQLDEAFVSRSGITVRGTVDASRIATQITGSPAK
jgi:hypothetical protein